MIPATAGSSASGDGHDHVLSAHAVHTDAPLVMCGCGTSRDMIRRQVASSLPNLAFPSCSRAATVSHKCKPQTSRGEPAPNQTHVPKQVQSLALARPLVKDECGCGTTIEVAV